jgi:hypothetical protein
MKICFETFSYRFAEQVLNSRLYIKQEIVSTLSAFQIILSELSRPKFYKILEELLVKKGWGKQPSVYDKPANPLANMDFIKDRIGIEVANGHLSFFGFDLLKFQVSSYSGLDKIDVGIYIVATKNFQKTMREEFGLNWMCNLSYERVRNYLPHFKNAIQVPIYVIGLDL